MSFSSSHSTGSGLSTKSNIEVDPIPYDGAPQARDRLQSIASLETGGTLSRQATAYSVQDIYGNMNENDIRLKRTCTKSTVLTTLSNRVARVQTNDNLSGSGGDDIYSKYISDVPVPVVDDGDEFCDIDPELVTWEGKDDPNHPRNWSMNQKIFQTVIVSLYTLISPMSSSVASPAINFIAEDLNMNSSFMKSFATTIMVLAWAIGPLVIAPLSESDSIGRRPVLNISIWIAFIFNLACGFAKTPVQLCVFRFLGGLGGCAPLNVGAGTLADLWSDEQRSIAISVYSLAPSLGPILSPIISSFIIEHKTWHWVFFVLAIWNFFVAVFGTIFFKETYSPTLLKHRARKLRKETGNEHLHTIYEIANGETAWEKLLVDISRPLTLLLTHPMVIGLGSFMAFVYGFMYLMLVTFPSVFRGVYGFSIGIAGLMYIPLGVGLVIGTIFWTWAINKVAAIMTARNNGVSKPEYRLPLLISSGIFIPVGLIWYGWSAEKKLHWIMPSIGSAIFGFALIAVFNTIQQYLIMMNNRFSASSVAAAAVFRSLFGFSFPLFATPMYAKLHYGWGNTMCAFIAMALGIPFPVFCVIYGERLRNWANRRMDKKQAERDARNLKRLQASNKIAENEIENDIASSKSCEELSEFKEDDTKHTYNK